MSDGMYTVSKEPLLGSRGVSHVFIFLTAVPVMIVLVFTNVPAAAQSAYLYLFFLVTKLHLVTRLSWQLGCLSQRIHRTPLWPVSGPRHSGERKVSSCALSFPARERVQAVQGGTHKQPYQDAKGDATELFSIGLPGPVVHLACGWFG